MTFAFYAIVLGEALGGQYFAANDERNSFNHEQGTTSYSYSLLVWEASWHSSQYWSLCGRGKPFELRNDECLSIEVVLEQLRTSVIS